MDAAVAESLCNLGGKKGWRSLAAKPENVFADNGLAVVFTLRHSVLHHEKFCGTAAEFYLTWRDRRFLMRKTEPQCSSPRLCLFLDWRTAPASAETLMHKDLNPAAAPAASPSTPALPDKLDAYWMPFTA